MAKPQVFFDITADGRPLDRIVMELRDDFVPKIALCTDKTGNGYKGSTFHRVIPGFMCHGGDFTRGDGIGGKSIYGNKFEDENFILKHTGAGILSMVPNFSYVLQGMNILKAVESYGSQNGNTSAKIIIANSGQLE